MAHASDTFATVGTSAVVLVGPSPRRTSLKVSVPSGNRVTISQRSNVTLGQGYTIQNATAPVEVGSGRD